jgi:hypothetical protein
MGRLESLTALALGRGHYEDEVILESDGAAEGSRGQQYNERGYPKNSETKRREREQVRAANEVMQVTGVVEDSVAAKAKVADLIAKKNQETLNGLRLMEVGRATLVGGVWGVLGLRRRILVWIPFWQIRILADQNSFTNLMPKLDFWRSSKGKHQLLRYRVWSSPAFPQS